MRFFLSSAKSFLKLLLCLLKFLISDRLSFAKDAFRVNLKGFVPVLKVLQCFLRDKTLELFYYVISFIAWNNPYVKL